MMSRFGLRTVLVAAVAVACLLSVLVCGAAAATPWWHVNTITAPPDRVGGEGQLVLEVSNLGDAPANGFVSPITIVDRLPAGFSVTHVYGEGGGSFQIGIDGVREIMKCASATEGVHAVITCSYDGPLLSYERFLVEIDGHAETEAGESADEVSVTGGGAAPVKWARMLNPSEGPSGFGVQDYEVTPEEEGGAFDSQAGSHPFQLTTTLSLTSKAVPVYKYEFGEVLPEVQPVELPKDLKFDLPPGLVGNPSAIPKCKLSLFLNANGSLCPDETVVGVATPITTNVNAKHLVPLAEAVPVYNIEPSVGEPARLGFTTQVGPVVIDTSVRTGSDYGVTVTVPNILDYIGVIGAQVTLWGVPGDHRHDTSRGKCLDDVNGTVHEVFFWETSCPLQEKPQPFLDLPTSCSGPLQSSVESDPWSEPGHYTTPTRSVFANGAGEPVAQDGCNHLGFDPSITVTPDGQAGSSPTGLTVGVHVDQQGSVNPTGLAQSSVKNTTVALPAGLVLDASGADGLSSCSLVQIALDSSSEQTCPESARVGTLEIKTPLLPNPLVGAAYLAAQNANPFGSLLALYLVAKDPVSGVLVKLAGEVSPQEGTGQLISTFKETPQLPFEDLRIDFFGGSRAPLGTPALCGAYTTTASFAPWSGNPPASSSSTFNIVSGPGGIPCSNPLPFAPSLTAGSLNLQAGAYSPFTMTISREDGEQNLQAVSLRMPAGLSGVLTGVPLCPEAQANAGTCSAASEIGETTVSVGLGGNPYTVKGGKVFITEKYDGAPYGLSIVNPAKAGPIDLGMVVVRARIEVDPLTAQLTVTTDGSAGPHPIPHILQGIPLEIKHVNVTINRPGFTFNPTNCNPLRITGSISSVQEATPTVFSAVSVPLQVTNCRALGFKPRFSVSTNGITTRARGASLHVKLAYPKAAFGSQTNIRSVKVSLPKLLPSNLKTLQKACTHQIFAANPASCPVESRVGFAKATTPVLPVPLTGPAYFVSYGGAKFPELVIVLSGYGTTVQLHGETFINKQNVTSSTFRSVPDVPVGTFELTLPQQSYAALAAPSPLCGHKLVMPTLFTAQNGAEIKQNTKISITGCAKHRTVKKKKR